MSKRPLLAIIDGKSVFYRGYYAMPALTTRDGMPTGGVYGFTSMSVELIKRLKPDYVAVAWDMAKTNIRSRKKIYPEYKAGRKPPPPDFYEQIPVLNELLDGFGWPLYELDDYEADDILGALAQQANAQGIEVALITSDLDALQLIGPMTRVYALKKGLSNIEQFDVAAFEAKYGINVHQFLDLKALKGDSSDNLPGVAGIGEKTGLALLQEFGTLDGIYENLDKIKVTTRKKLEAGRESAYMTKKVAELWCDAPVKLDLEAMDVKKYDREKLRELLTQLEFRGLLNRLQEELNDIGGDVDKQHVQKPKVPTRTLSQVESVSDLKDLQDHTLESEKYVVAGWCEEKLILADTKNIWTIDKTTLADKAIQKVVQTILDEVDLLVGYDVKQIMHEINSYNLLINGSVFDVKIAAFLLNSLIRDKSLAALAGDDIDQNDPQQYVQAVAELFEYQKTELETLPKLNNLANNVEFSIIKILFAMEKHGIKLDINVLAELESKFAKELKLIENSIYEQAGREFNINSPAQLSQVLFDELGLPTAGIKKGKTSFSTGIKELNKLQPLHPIIDLIYGYRELSKILNTYVVPLPKLIDKNSYLHTNFALDVAATGRLSSANPNLQNIPIRSEHGNKIREAFVPAKGNVFVSADYSQFELRLAAVLTDDKNMIKAFEDGADIHLQTAAELYGIPPVEVTKNQRSSAKAVNFGIMYGLGPHALSESTDMNFTEAREFIERYFAIRPKLKDYLDHIRELATEQGYVETLFGRRRPTPDIKSSNFIVREAAYRAAINMPLQGSAADIMKMAMIEVATKLPKGAEQILQIHDSIVIECTEDQATQVAKILVETMENIYPQLGINLKVDATIGKNWSEL